MMLAYRMTVLALGCLVAILIANSGDNLAAQQKFDPAVVFKKADANGDGKVSKDEWKKFTENAPKVKENPKGGDFLFNFLDANRDGFLTADEFRRGAALRKKGQDGTPPKVEAPKEQPSIKPATAEGLAFFEKSIRPVLVKECYSCHSADAEKIKGGLTLDTRDGLLKGGDTGPAIVPGDARRSLLIKALKHTDQDTAMPPKKKLGDDVIADFEKWVAMGAPDPRDGTATKVVKNEIDIEKGRQFWSFQPVKKPAPPKTADSKWPATDIDRFLLAAMEEKKLAPVADADAATLLRRLTFDLVGLPPTPEEIDVFAKEFAVDPRAAVEHAADRLLASPRFGERWGRHWLDVARYGESSGRSSNQAYPHAWRYRDYVINAFNADKPYDQFIREQLAGDLLPTKDDREKAEFLIATGFLAIGSKVHDERNPRQFQMDLVDEQIDATFQAFQGLTVACARCHDHKFDPIPQKDYYALAGIFRSTETCYGTIRVIQSNQPSSLIQLPKGAEAPVALQPLSAQRREAIEKQIKDLDEEIKKAAGGVDGFLNTLRQRTQISTLRSQLATYEADGTPKPQAMGVRDRSFPSDSEFYTRGELDQAGAKVKRGFPQVLTTKQPSIARGSGRKELADFIASKDNPLTARVMANRVWLHLFGKGLVPTADNFGASGLPCSHPALLDYLAARFVEDGWSVKNLVKTIVLSRAYGLSSKLDPKNNDIDPDNVYVWRMPKRRLEVEPLRDTMLTLGTGLELKPPVGTSVARGGEGNVAFQMLRPMFGKGGPGMGGAGDPAGNDPHRTVYLAVVRDSLPELFTIFDFPDPSLIMGERAATTIPAQSLYLMNNPFVIRQAEALADKLLASGDDDGGKLARAYQLCYSRSPTEKEIAAANKFLESYGKNAGKKSSWAALCQALFASAEFSQR